MTPSNMFKCFAGMAMIADGAVALVNPEGVARLCNRGPTPWRHVMTAIQKYPDITRVVAALEVVGGVCWAGQALEPDSRTTAA